ncbi:MAG: hypothetical protein D6812_10045 [Deltaproteobacteria bacterium]|nr:MAG: hypothetical protein D6812_10045 [Deltaproteobacteria bacterium]
MRKRIGIALGGGAARGLAHIGVLDALQKAGIGIDVITGTSMGALVAALYAASAGKIEYVYETAESFLHSPLFRRMKIDFLRERNEQTEGGLLYNFSNFIKKGVLFSTSVTKRSFIPPETFETLIASLVEDLLIEDLPIPFAAVATDITKGRPVLLDRGRLRRAIHASAAIPGVCPPVTENGRELVDGGLLSNVPVDAARILGADVVIAVDVSASLDETSDMRTGLNILFRGHEITRAVLNRLEVERADLVIRPEVGHIHWANFGRFERCVEKGREAVWDRLDELRALLRVSWQEWMGRVIYPLWQRLFKEPKRPREALLFSPRLEV